MAKKKKSGKKQVTLSFNQAVVFVIIFAVVGVFAIMQSLAAPGGKGGGGSKPVRGGSGTISAPVLVTDRNTDGQLNWGDTIKFNLTTVGLSSPTVNLNCYVNGSLVSQGFEGYFPGTLDDGIFGLSSAKWASGAADCTASLTNAYQSYAYATVNFHVNP